MSNHLGNVLAVISDRKRGMGISGVNYAYFDAVTVSATDYYPFGMSMPGRTYNTEGYRYSFNGKEDDAEWAKQDYGFRIYDKRINRFLSIDPLTKKYPELTPYQFASNTPIMAIDLDGLEANVRTLPQRGTIARRAQENSQRKAANNSENYETATYSSPPREVRNGRTQPNYVEDANGKPSIDYGFHPIPTTGVIRSASESSTYDQVQLTPGIIISSLSKAASKALEQARIKEEETMLEEQFNMEHPTSVNYVFRGLNPLTDRNVETEGLRARDTKANISVSDHVEGERKSNWISTTLSFGLAWNNYSGYKNGMVAIDLTKIQTEVIHAAFDLMANNYGKKQGIHSVILSMAMKSQEILINLYVPRTAIIIIKSPPK